MNGWAARIETATVAAAENARESWSSEDVKFVMEMTDVERDEDIAYAVGRSLYAIWSIQSRVRAGEFDESGRAKSARVEREARVCDACFTIVTASGTCLCE